MAARPSYEPACDGEVHAWRILAEREQGRTIAVAECCGVRAELVRGEWQVVPLPPATAG